MLTFYIFWKFYSFSKLVRILIFTLQTKARVTLKNLQYYKLLLKKVPLMFKLSGFSLKLISLLNFQLN